MSLNFQTVPLIVSGLGKILILSDICNQLNIKKECNKNTFVKFDDKESCFN